MEPKLTRQSEAILAKLQVDVQRHFLTPEELAKLRKGLALMESLGIIGRFVITIAAVIASFTAILQFWPTNGVR